jgi:hypothetical protein
MMMLDRVATDIRTHAGREVLREIRELLALRRRSAT